MTVIGPARDISSRHLRSTTPLELDPLGRVTAFYFTTAIGLVSVGAAVSLTLSPTGSEQVSSPPLAALALVVLAGAFVGFAIVASPGASPLTRLRFQAVLSLIISANVLSAISQFGSNHLARDDWGPICLGLALLACAPFRSSYEILWFTVQAVLTAGILAAFQAFTSEVPANAIIIVVVAITPPLGIGLGAAAYSRSLVAGLRRLQRVEADSRSTHDDELRRRLQEEDSVGELGSLRSEVVPFFKRLDVQGHMTEADSKRATELSAGLRLAIVERLSHDPLFGLVSQFSDPERASRSLGERQRAALRALIAAATGLAGVHSGSLTLALAHEPGRGVSGTLTFGGGDPEGSQATLKPFVRMLRFVCGQAKFTIASDVTTIRFVTLRPE